MEGFKSLKVTILAVVLTPHKKSASSVNFMQWQGNKPVTRRLSLDLIYNWSSLMIRSDDVSRERD